METGRYRPLTSSAVLYLRECSSVAVTGGGKGHHKRGIQLTTHTMLHLTCTCHIVQIDIACLLTGSAISFTLSDSNHDMI